MSSLKVAVSSNIYAANLTINNNNNNTFLLINFRFETNKRKNIYKFIITSDFIDLSS